ncbi:hypothetical protein N7478_012286 [Penicillium angulare]|uniref:uncharacterized protein n=1 Tax=Penicillium angulare TaxID=116970 RepID=UPI002540DEAC|nr:uncharacterized protein N7478_012286 [Penicillium angulare]KAJ5259305.1 hypothetical protein N7478_012286 [Penicillium angulare]
MAAGSTCLAESDKPSGDRLLSIPSSHRPRTARSIGSNATAGLCNSYAKQSSKLSFGDPRHRQRGPPGHQASNSWKSTHGLEIVVSSRNSPLPEWKAAGYIDMMVLESRASIASHHNVHTVLNGGDPTAEAN